LKGENKLKIALIVEGSYPFVSGGVASWTHTLISKMPEYEFTILAIMPAEAAINPDKWKYDPPSNAEVKVYTLGGKEEAKMPPHLTTEQKNALIAFFLSEDEGSEALEFLGIQSILGNVSGFFESSDFWEIVKECYQREGLHRSFIDYFWMLRNKYEPLTYLLQSHYEEFDLVHAVSTGYAGLLGSYLARKKKTPYIVTEHGIYSREREEEILQANWIPSIYKKRWIKYFHFLSRLAYNQADKLVTLFPKNMKLQEGLGANPEKQLVIANGISVPESLPKKSVYSRERTLQIGAIVRVVPIKDIVNMIFAASMLKEKHIDFHLSIYGPLDEDPEYALECKELIEELDLRSFVTLEGKVDVPSKLKSIDLLLLTSISEGQPLAILEGMAAGLPFVATNVGDCMHLLTGDGEDKFGDAGKVVPPVNPRRLAESIEGYIQHPAMLETHGKNGFYRVQNDYQLSTVIEKYQSLYIEVGGIN
jgi:polysaccharide biosynthesis protein PelF